MLKLVYLVKAFVRECFLGHGCCGMYYEAMPCEMDETKEYSVFDDLPEQQDAAPVSAGHRLAYHVFVGYFIVTALVRWGYFAAFRRMAIANPALEITPLSIFYFISAFSISIVIVSSLVLFYRSSLRASIGLLIVGALMELAFHYFMKYY